MLRAEVLETMLYDCVTWSPRACQYDTSSRAHHCFLARCIRWLKNNGTDHPISYLDTLIKTGSGICGAYGDTILPKGVMFGELVGAAGCARDQEK